MNKFKKGDIVVCIDSSNTDGDLKKGKIYTISNSDYYAYLFETGRRHWKKDRFEYAILDCKLNRALYPELKPDGKGSLVWISK